MCLKKLALTRSVVAVVASLFLSLVAYGEDYRIGCWNLEWFFDADQSDNSSNLAKQMSAPTPEAYLWRVRQIAAAIADVKPTVLGLEEIENRAVVRDLAQELRIQHQLGYQVAFVQGADSFTEQDVAFLVRDGITFEASRFAFAGQGNPELKDVSKHLHVKLSLDQEEMHLVLVHLITKDNDRPRQVRTLREWIGGIIPSKNVVVLGDFNFHVGFDQTGTDSDVAVMRGLNTVQTSDDLFDLHQMLPANGRNTHAGGGQLDRILVSPSLMDQEGLRVTEVQVRKDVAIRGSVDRGSGVNWNLPDGERDLSDHFALLATLSSGGASGAPQLRMAAPETGREENITEILRRLERLEQEIKELKEKMPANRP